MQKIVANINPNTFLNEDKLRDLLDRVNAINGVKSAEPDRHSLEWDLVVVLQEDASIDYVKYALRKIGIYEIRNKSG